MVSLHTQIWVKDHSGREETEYPDASPFRSYKQWLPPRGQSTEGRKKVALWWRCPTDAQVVNTTVITLTDGTRPGHVCEKGTSPPWASPKPSPPMRDARRTSPVGHPTEHLTPNCPGHENQGGLRDCFSAKQTKDLTTCHAGSWDRRGKSQKQEIRRQCRLWIVVTT